MRERVDYGRRTCGSNLPGVRRCKTAKRGSPTSIPGETFRSQSGAPGKGTGSVIREFCDGLELIGFRDDAG